MMQNEKEKISSYFNLNKAQSELEFLDVRLDTDVRLFIDPTSFPLLDNDWGLECTSLIRGYFQKVINYIKQGNKKGALALLSFLNEPNETHLGFSKRRSIGKGLGIDRAIKLYDSLVESEVVNSGLLEDLEETAFMIDGIGPDMISDIVTNIIRGKLIEYTQEMCQKYEIPTSLVSSGYVLNLDNERWEKTEVWLPGPKSRNGHYEKLLLVPKDIVRRSPSYEAEKFNYDNIIPAIIDREFKLGLGRVVNGTLQPHTKETIKKRQKGFSRKPLNRKFLMENPEVLSNYKKKMADNPLPRMSDEELSEILDKPIIRE